MRTQLESIAADLRFGLRHLGRTPLATVTMIGVFALGIGCNTALFVFVSSLLTSPPPGIEGHASLVRIRGIDHSRGPGNTIGREFSYPEYRDYAAREELFSSVAAWTSADVALDVGRDEPNLQSGAATFVTAGYFQVLGVNPIMGAGLPTDAADSGAPELAGVISHAVWDRHFGQAPDVVGRTIRVNGVAVTIVGVAPRRFAGARTGGSQMRVWLPLNAHSSVVRAATLDPLNQPLFGLVARLRPGIGIDQTLPAVQTIAARHSQATGAGVSPGVLTTDVVGLVGDNYFPPSGQDAEGIGRIATLAIPVIILLITCTNVSALLAGLAVARRREIAVRLSLGAPRRRIVRQLLTESVMLALAAGAAGLLIIWAMLRVFDVSVPDVQLVLDWRALAFTAGVAVAAGVLFGVSPALHVTRLALSEVIKDAAGSLVPGRSRLQAALVVAQVAFTQPALLAMGAMILELAGEARRLPVVAADDRTLEVRFNVNPRYGSMDDAREATIDRLEARFASLPGVVAVVPQESAEDYFAIALHPDDRVDGAGPPAGQLPIRAHASPPGYLPLVGTPVVRGRDFETADGDANGAAIMDEGLARRLWGAADPIGRRFTSVGTNRRGIPVFTVVGVIRDMTSEANDGSEPRIFLPTVGITGHVLVRTAGPADPVAAVIRSAANDEAPELPLVSVRTLEAIVAEERGFYTRIMAAAGGSGLLALGLSAIGLYAIVAFAVGQRIREIGIRTALGAQQVQVVGMFVLRGLRLSLLGTFLGLALSVGVLRLITLSGGTSLPDGIFVLAALTACAVVMVASIAAWIPARAAAHIDPLDALRAE